MNDLEEIRTSITELLKPVGLSDYYRNFINTADSGLWGQYPDRPERTSLETYTVMEKCFRDPQVRSCFHISAFNVIKQPGCFHPPKNIKDDKLLSQSQEMSDFLNWSLKNFDGSVIQLKYELMLMKFFNKSVVEKFYKIVQEGQYKNFYSYDSFLARYPGLWQFIKNSNGKIIGLKNLDDVYNSGYYSLDKFLYGLWLPTWGNEGNGDFNSIVPFWKAKVEFITFILAGGAKQAQAKLPLLFNESGQDPKASETERKAILTALRKGMGAYIPKGWRVELHDFKIENLKVFIDVFGLLDGQIALSCLGSTLSNNENRGTGSRAQAEVHKETGTDNYNEYACKALEEIFTELYAKPLLRLNYNYDSELYPEYVIGEEEPEDLVTTANILEKLKNINVFDPMTDTDLLYARNKFNLPENDEIFERNEIEEEPDIVTDDINNSDDDIYV